MPWSYLVCNLPNVKDRRTSNATIGRNLAAVVAQSGQTLDTIAEATGLAPEDLRAFTCGDADMNAADLVRVGGFLHVEVRYLIGAV